MRSVGRGKKNIEELLEEWNNKNREPLRDVLIKGHIRYHCSRKKVLPPPNCKKYYQELTVCTPNIIRQRIKNTVNYSLRKSLENKKRSTRLTDEQKELRRKYRQKLRENKKKLLTKEINEDSK